MAVPVEEAIAALSTFSLEDDQAEVQGAGVLVSSERGATNSPIEYGDVSAYRLSLSEDTKALNQLNALIQEGKEMASVLYTYRSCVKALPQLPESMKHSQADLYLETYQVLDLEMSRLREIQRWQASAASKLAADMQRFSRPERHINGPTITHLWSMLKLLDVLVQLDHLKNAKASIPNDFSWYKRTFTQVSVQWQDIDSMREELDDLQIFLSTRWAILLNLHVEMFRVNNIVGITMWSLTRKSVEDILQVLIVFAVESLELDFALLFPERHILLRVLPVLVVLATSSEKDSESLYKRVKINRLINIFKNDPVIPAFPDLHLSPAAILKELSIYFQRFSAQTRLLTLPAPHELPPRDAQEYPQHLSLTYCTYQRHYLIINHIGTIRAEHDDFTIRFASSLNQLLLLKSIDGADVDWCKEVKGNMYDMVVEGFQLLSRWTARIWEQCAWKFSRPCKEAIPSESNGSSESFFDYEKVVRYNYSAEERKALVELVSYIKSVGSLMHRRDTLVVDALWETIHAEVQDFVQNTLATMLRTTFRKKKDLSRILSDMRTLSADWMANTSKPESDLQSHGGDESKGSFFYPRPVAPTATQVHCLQFLIYEVVSGGNHRKPGGLFGNNGSEIPVNDLKQLESFFYKLSFFLHILDYSATVATLTDLGFLWFREFYLESSRVIQFPIECSLPWMLVDHVLESQNAGLLESVLMPFDIYNDSAQQALAALRQRFLYDEIEAEVDHCFDLFVSKLCEIIFTCYKSWAASEMLDPSFLFALDNGEKYSVQPMRFTALFKMTRVKLLGRTIDLRSLVSERMNKVFRDNIEFLFDRFESQDLCAVVELEKLLEILKHAHGLLSKDISIDSFSLMLNEMQENLSLVSFSSRLATQIWSEMQSDFLPNFVLCNTTQRFVRSSRVPLVPVQKPSVPHAKDNFYCGTQELNSAHQSFARLHSGFFGIPHMFSVVRLLGSRSLPWLIRALLDHITNKVTTLEPMITGLQAALPKSIGLLPFDGGVTGCMRVVKENLNWGTKSELKAKVLRGIKEIGSVLYWMGLLDIVLREVDTMHFMQTAPWLGLFPGADGQILHSQDGGDSPVVNLFKSATSAIVSNPGCPNPTSFYTMSKQAEAADLLYKANMTTGSVLEYALAFTSAALDKYCSKWSAAPKTGFIDITTSKDFYRIYSGLQISLNQSLNARCPNLFSPSIFIIGHICFSCYIVGNDVLREVDTMHFMQTAPWLGLFPGADGQILHSQDGGDSPVVNLFKSATSAIVSNPGCPNPTSFYTMSKQAEAADLLYKANMTTGSVLEYALAFTSAALDKYCSKWSAAPKTGFIDITTSKDFYRIYSGLQIGHLEDSVQVSSNNFEVLGDSVAWGGCTIIYLLGQQMHFELFDFSYQVLNIAEVEAGLLSQAHKNPHVAQGWETLLEAMKKARRLNNHVFSMLKARCPLEDKIACAIKQSGAPLHRIKFENTVSAFETLPQKGA
ncbi:protein PIR [Populus alba x Populus x berolinensis]|uniref:Protein PIR n=1 Tax=Populus alba x Populus x berolinensis TaxID=444605 RepID=A0AAD6L7B2_9ROSI|nr:protein PIR [Populus alba x Populus x berolinensis]